MKAMHEPFYHASSHAPSDQNQFNAPSIYMPHTLKQPSLIPRLFFWNETTMHLPWAHYRATHICQTSNTCKSANSIFERESNNSNANSNHSNEIPNKRMQIRTIRQGFYPFESKHQAFDRDSKQSNENSNHSKGSLTITHCVYTMYKQSLLVLHVMRYQRTLTFPFP